MPYSEDFNNEQQVETCMLDNLAECVSLSAFPRIYQIIYEFVRFFLSRSLNTESTSVRAKIVAHGNDLISLGVDGLRIDAAKRASHLYPPTYSSR